MAQRSMFPLAYARDEGSARPEVSPQGRGSGRKRQGRGRSKGKGKGTERHSARADSSGDLGARSDEARGESSAPISDALARANSTRRSWSWVALANELLTLAMTRRFLIAHEWIAAAQRSKKLRTTPRQWFCLHPLSRREAKGNRHGAFVLCQRCCLWWAFALRQRRHGEREYGRAEGPVNASLDELHDMAQGVQMISAMRRHARAKSSVYHRHAGVGDSPLPCGEIGVGDSPVPRVSHWKRSIAEK